MQQPQLRSILRPSLLVVAALLLGSCGSDGEPSGSQPTTRTAPTEESPRGSSKAPALRLHEVGDFDQPVLATAVPETDLVAVVEKGGRIRFAAGMRCLAASRCPTQPVTEGRVVLDVSRDISTGSEQGLLGMAFHPDWPSDPRVFINYTDRDGDTRIQAWALDGPAGMARRERELLRIDQPYENHNGGHVAFGHDGLLYIGTGDGGSGGDPEDRAQSPDEELGKLLRLNVDAGAERGYAIPEGNLRDGAPTVWALGLRNPWRFSFDRTSGDLWIGDVGQDEREEIDVVSRAQVEGPDTLNFGWRLREGFAEFEGSGETGPGTLVAPVLDFGQDAGCSVTGGVVYRGKLVPKLNGWYLFADFCGQEIRLLRAEGLPGSTHDEGEVKWSRGPEATQVASFGETHGGEVLVVSLDGKIYQVVDGS